MGTFTRIFGRGDKKLQKQADELLLKLSKALQSASAKLRVATEAWEEGDEKVLKELRREVIDLERNADQIKEELFYGIFSKHAYLPQQTQERFELVNRMDGIIDSAEEAVRMILAARNVKPRHEIIEVASKCWTCTDLLQDAIKWLFKDFEKSAELTLKIDKVREEARDIWFDFVGRLFKEENLDTKEILLFRIVSDRILQVAIGAEATGDFIRALAIKYS